MTALVAVICLCISYLTGRRDGFNEAAMEWHEQVDTLFIRDTIVSEKAVVEKKVVLQEVPVPVYKTDTLWRHDTMYVYLQREQVIWQDSLSRVYASGIDPHVDSVHHFISERVVTREVTNVVKKPCRWGLGVHAGYGVQFGEEIHAAPYVGVGISFNLLSW